MARKPDLYLIDDENPEWTAEEVAQARPASEVLPPDLYAELSKRRPGRPKSEAPKVAVKLRLDPDIVEAYKAEGAGWQMRINAALRKTVTVKRRAKG